jgi:hypothetical protein
MAKFESGKTYFTRSVCDYDCIITVSILSRTAKTIKANVRGEEKTFRITEYSGVEQIKPWGNYSMCPILSADRIAA